MRGPFVCPSGSVGNNDASWPGPGSEVHPYILKYPEDVESIKTVHGHGVVSLQNGYILAGVDDCDGQPLRYGAVIALVPESVGPDGSTGRWMSPGFGLVGADESHPAVAVEVRLTVRLPDELRELRRS